MGAISLPLPMSCANSCSSKQHRAETKKKSIYIYVKHNLHMNCVEINFHACIYTMKINLNLIPLVSCHIMCLTPIWLLSISMRARSARTRSRTHTAHMAPVHVFLYVMYCFDRRRIPFAIVSIYLSASKRKRFISLWHWARSAKSHFIHRNIQSASISIFNSKSSQQTR